MNGTKMQRSNAAIAHSIQEKTKTLFDLLTILNYNEEKEHYGMEPRTRILFISYIVIVLFIVGIGVVPYFVKGDYKKDTLVTESPAVGKVMQTDDNFVGTVHIIDTNALTHEVRFQLLDDNAFFEQASERLYNIMDGRKGRDIVISYKKASKDGSVRYNFSESLEVLPNR